MTDWHLDDIYDFRRREPRHFGIERLATDPELVRWNVSKKPDCAVHPDALELQSFIEKVEEAARAGVRRANRTLGAAIAKFDKYFTDPADVRKMGVALQEAENRGTQHTHLAAAAHEQTGAGRRISQLFSRWRASRVLSPGSRL